jgi:hypothetical protein
MIFQKRTQKSSPRRKRQKTRFLLALRPQALSMQGLIVMMSRAMIPALGNRKPSRGYPTAQISMVASGSAECGFFRLGV